MEIEEDVFIPGTPIHKSYVDSRLDDEVLYVDNDQIDLNVDVDSIVPIPEKKGLFTESLKDHVDNFPYIG